MGFLRRLIKKAQTDKFGFYSQAEEIALNAPQKKMRGDDARRMFIKNGVTKQELQDLGLDDLFRQDRVTQDEILKVIGENRIEFTATEYKGAAPSNIGFDTDVLSFEEANQRLFVELDDGRKLTYFPFLEAQDGRFGVFADQYEIEARLKASGLSPLIEVVGVLDTGPDATNFKFVEEVTEGMPVFEEGSTNVIGRVKKEFDPDSARITEILEDEDLARESLNVGYNRNENIISYIMDEDNESIRDFLFEGASLDVLDSTDKDILYDAAYLDMEQQYLYEPIEKVTATVDGNPTPYSMVGNNNLGFNLSVLSDPRLLREGRNFFDNYVPGVQEAEIQLSAALEQYENIFEGDEGNLRWESSTLPGGENPVETVFQLKLPELLFSENIHYPYAENQVFHVRTKDRRDKNGNLILYVEEFQSDWGQTGRREGFVDPEAIEYAESKAKDEFEGLFDIYEGIKAKDSYTLPGFIDQTARALSEPYNIRDVSPADSVKFGIRSRSMERIKRALDDHYDREKTIAQELRRDAIVHSFSIDEKKAALKKVYEDALYDGQRSQNFYLPKVLKDRLLRIDQDRASFSDDPVILARQTISEYVDTDDLFAIDEKIKQFSSPGQWNSSLPSVAAFNKEAFGRLLQAFDAESYGKVNRDLNQQASELLETTLELEGLPRDAMRRLREAYNRFSTDEKAKKGVKMISPYTTFVKKAPFVTDTESWNNLGMKYIFDRAAREGYDGVSFTPGEVQKNRWNNPGLIGAYDEQIPFSIKRIFNPSEKTTGKPQGKTITVEDEDGIKHTSRVFLLDESTKDGQTIGQKAAKRRGMYTIPPVGLLSLQMLPAEKAQAAEEEQKVKELEHAFADAPERVSRTRSGMPISERSSGILGALRGAGEVGYEAISDLFVEPFMGMAGAEAAFEMGATPEQVEAASKRAASLVDFETSSPTGKRYKESLKGGLKALSEYLMEESKPLPRNRYTRGSRATQSLDLLQSLFQKGIIPASEAVTDAALGIISLDPRDTEEMEEIRKEAYRPVIEAIQPI
tara:strand:- start:5275 stop:8367 length:3093 start_codon:yes stop_codon:yes gene_type:complete